MEEIAYTDELIRREWRNTEGELHRTIGSAVEEWTVLPGGGHVLSYQVWYVNGKRHRVGRPAYRSWHVANDGTRVLEWEEWWQHGMEHRVGGPSYHQWTAKPDGIQTVHWERWCVDGNLHRVDGLAFYGRWFYWHGKEVREEDLPWLRRGRTCLIALACFPTATEGRGASGSAVSPAWSRDMRLSDTLDTVLTQVTYRSAAGGITLLCV